MDDLQGEALGLKQNFEVKETPKQRIKRLQRERNRRFKQNMGAEKHAEYMRKYSLNRKPRSVKDRKKRKENYKNMSEAQRAESRRQGRLWGRIRALRRKTQTPEIEKQIQELKHQIKCQVFTNITPSSVKSIQDFEMVNVKKEKLFNCEIAVSKKCKSSKKPLKNPVRSKLKKMSLQDESSGGELSFQVKETLEERRKRLQRERSRRFRQSMSAEKYAEYMLKYRRSYKPLNREEKKKREEKYKNMSVAQRTEKRRQDKLWYKIGILRKKSQTPEIEKHIEELKHQIKCNKVLINSTESSVKEIQDAEIVNVQKESTFNCEISMNKNSELFKIEEDSYEKGKNPVMSKKERYIVEDESSDDEERKRALRIERGRIYRQNMSEAQKAEKRRQDRLYSRITTLRRKKQTPEVKMKIQELRQQIKNKVPINNTDSSVKGTQDAEIVNVQKENTFCCEISINKNDELFKIEEDGYENGKKSVTSKTEDEPSDNEERKRRLRRERDRMYRRNMSEAQKAYKRRQDRLYSRITTLRRKKQTPEIKRKIQKLRQQIKSSKITTLRKKNKNGELFKIKEDSCENGKNPVTSNKPEGASSNNEQNFKIEKMLENGEKRLLRERCRRSVQNMFEAKYSKQEMKDKLYCERPTAKARKKYKERYKNMSEAQKAEKRRQDKLWRQITKLRWTKITPEVEKQIQELKEQIKCPSIICSPASPVQMAQTTKIETVEKEKSFSDEIHIGGETSKIKGDSFFKKNNSVSFHTEGEDRSSTNEDSFLIQETPEERKRRLRIEGCRRYRQRMSEAQRAEKRRRDRLYGRIKTLRKRRQTPAIRREIQDLKKQIKRKGLINSTAYSTQLKKEISSNEITTQNTIEVLKDEMRRQDKVNKCNSISNLREKKGISEIEKHIHDLKLQTECTVMINRTAFPTQVTQISKTVNAKPKEISSTEMTAEEWRNKIKKKMEAVNKKLKKQKQKNKILRDRVRQLKSQKKQESYRYLKNIGLEQISAATEWISTPYEEVQKKARMHYDRIRQVTSTLEDEFDEIVKEKLNGAFRATIKDEILKFIRRQSTLVEEENSENAVDEESFLVDKDISEILVGQQSSLVNEDNSENILNRQASVDEDNSEIILHRQASFVDEGDSEHRQASLVDENDSEIILDKQDFFVEDDDSEIMDVLNGVEDNNDSENNVNMVNGVVEIKEEILSDDEDGKTENKKTNDMFQSGSDFEEIFLDSPLSSVHTSDLSSFDDEISISSEEGNEKRRVSLKFAEEEIQRVKENKASEEHIQEKRKKTKNAESGHQSQEESSDSTSATSSSRRVRKPNSKYFSNDVLSPFDNNKAPATNAVPIPINSQDTSSAPRKRGRPRKHSRNLKAVNSNHVSSTFDASQDTPAVARKRGRPKKFGD